MLPKGKIHHLLFNTSVKLGVETRKFCNLLKASIISRFRGKISQVTTIHIVYYFEITAVLYLSLNNKVQGNITQFQRGAEIDSCAPLLILEYYISNAYTLFTSWDLVGER